MEKTLFLIGIIITFMLIAFAWHIRSNPELPRQNKRFLIASALLLVATLILESIAILLDGKTGNLSGYYILLIADSIVSIWVVPMQVLGFDFRKEGKAVSVITAVFSVFILAAAPSRLIFYVSEDGIYSRGRLFASMTVLVLLTAVSSLLILFGLAKRFGKSELLTLLLTGILEVMGVVFSLIGGYEIIRLAAFALAFMLVYSYYESLSEQETYSELKQSKKRNEELSLQMVRALVSAVDAKDKYTNGHSQRVSDYAVLLAEKLGWSEERIYQLKYEGLMHDVGKIGIPDSVLNKQGRLSDAEFKIIKSHTIFGADILKEMDSVPGACEAARWHHERYDGKGYPDGIAGKDIPENARIISIADTFDAMNSDRIYRRALPKDIIIKELEKGKGSQFDPEYADAFIDLFKDGAMDEIAVSGRRDAEADVDEVTEEIRDFFEMFYVAHEEGGWEDNYTKTERMRKYLVGMAKRNETNIEIAIVSVGPKPEFALSDEDLDTAVNVMMTAIDNSVPELIACGRISKTQIVTIRKVVEGPDLSQFLQLTFVYYYKLFKAEAVDIAFDILGKTDQKDVDGK